MYKEFVVEDNWYTKEELDLVYKELDFLSLTKNNSDEVEGPALDNNNKSKFKGFRIYPYDVYSDTGVKYSPILKSIKKFQNKEFHKKIKDAFKNTETALYDQFIETNYSTSLINYYENNSIYKEHFDAFQFTSLIFIYKEPKSFTGGDLYFPRINKKIECINNRMVLFPSFYFHETDTIKSETNKKGEGRYSITTFFSRRA